MIEYLIIAILQGLFEWLPISSSGQVMIFSTTLFNISPEEAFSLAIFLHLGTALAVIFKFRVDFIKIFKSIVPKVNNIDEIDIKKRNWLIYATIGTAITAIPLYFLFKILIITRFTAFQGDIITLIISGLLIVTGLILLKVKKAFGDNVITDISKDQIKKDSFISGLVQGVSILPGISRSGVTVSTIIYEKYNQENALKLSFLMSVPVVFASIGVDIIFGEGSVFGTLDILTIFLITLISFIVGYFSIEILLKIANKIEFGYFCVLYGIITYAIVLPVLIITSIA
ncbi:MAG: undecaprenyl-diphosphate phosphatase [Candidatus Lokiarchaeota archaeon]|nr:undecaprenyl-diphosphate phosphatase [Candidatus Lokiarchaeota archaeon]